MSLYGLRRQRTSSNWTILRGPRPLGSVFELRRCYQRQRELYKEETIPRQVPSMFSGALSLLRLNVIAKSVFSSVPAWLRSKRLRPKTAEWRSCEWTEKQKSGAKSAQRLVVRNNVAKTAPRKIAALKRRNDARIVPGSYSSSSSSKCSC